jgi:hypothetical protein
LSTLSLHYSKQSPNLNSTFVKHTIVRLVVITNLQVSLPGLEENFIASGDKRKHPELPLSVQPSKAFVVVEEGLDEGVRPVVSQFVLLADSVAMARAYEVQTRESILEGFRAGLLEHWGAASSEQIQLAQNIVAGVLEQAAMSSQPLPFLESNPPHRVGATYPVQDVVSLFLIEK